MATLKEMAQQYEPPKTKNIAELECFPIDITIVEEEHTKSDGETFKVKVIEIEGSKYRVPNSVLEGIKGLIQKLPSTKYVTVLKSGEGMGTKYQVLPYDSEKEIKEEKVQ